MTNNYKTIWKTLHAEKSITAANMVQYCVLKAMAAKGDNKVEILNALIKKAFSPSNDGNYDGLKVAVYDALYRFKTTIFRVPVATLLDNDQLAVYRGLLGSISTDRVVDDNEYSYIFVRQDIKPEYQLVQAAHVTCVLGKYLEADPSKLNFVVVGVKDEDTLESVYKLLGKKGHKFVDFIEPDIGDQRTALATFPIRGEMRKDFRKFKLLTF